MGTELEVSRSDLPMELSVTDLLAQVRKIQDVMKNCMRENEHFGIIPGTNKPTLLKPGAEKLNLVFRFDPQYDSVDRYDGDHLTIKSKCTLFHIPTGMRIGSGEGSCSTKESKYAFRNAQIVCPQCGKETVIKGRPEYGGGYLCFTKKGGCGAKFPDDEFNGQAFGKVANDNLADQYNTVLKMANKRSLIAAVLNATAASDIFTQDTEDMVENSHRFNGEPPKQAPGSGGGLGGGPVRETKETPRQTREPMSYKTVLWDNLVKHAGNSKGAGELLLKLCGKRFISNLTEDEAKVIQEKFEREVLATGFDEKQGTADNGNF
jgi:DNA-directed RNA polymerase subunit RPC12/RpoP